MTTKEFYFAGDVAKVFDLTPIAVRQWRDRSGCDYGYTELSNGVENPNARRRYTAVDVCKIAIALALAAKGYGLESTFRFAATTDVVAVVEQVTPSSEDMFLLIVGLFDGNAVLVEHLLVVRKYELGDRINQAFTAEDWLTSRPYDTVDVVNLSAIARRTLAALAELD